MNLTLKKIDLSIVVETFGSGFMVKKGNGEIYITTKEAQQVINLLTLHLRETKINSIIKK